MSGPVDAATLARWLDLARHAATCLQGDMPRHPSGTERLDDAYVTLEALQGALDAAWLDAVHRETAALSRQGGGE